MLLYKAVQRWKVYVRLPQYVRPKLGSWGETWHEYSYNGKCTGWCLSLPCTGRCVRVLLVFPMTACN